MAEPFESHDENSGLDEDVGATVSPDGLPQPLASTQEGEETSALISRCQQGDLEAFDRLMELHQSRIYNLAFRMTGSREDAYDITQDTFLRAYNALPRFRGESSFSTWIYRIGCNICLDEIKRRSRQKVRVISSTVQTEAGGEEYDLIDRTGDSSSDPQEIYEQRERQRLIQKTIATLPEHHRSVVVLCDLQGEPYEEIAQILGISIGTVKSRLNRARLTLKSRLEALREQI